MENIKDKLFHVLHLKTLNAVKNVFLKQVNAVLTERKEYRAFFLFSKACQI